MRYLKNNFIIIICLSVLFTSCVPYKKLKYFNNIDEINNKSIVQVRTQKLIRPFDNIYVKVLSTDEKTSKIFNTADDFRGSLTTNLMGYLVNEKGEIDFPFIGSIKVTGLTTFQAGDAIEKAINEYLPNTSVIVKFLDTKITVLGEVQRAGILQFSDDQLTIYQAIGLAGGLTRYGNRKNIVLIRLEDNKSTYYKLDLTNSKIAESNLYFIQPNDVIIVEPLKSISWSYQNLTYSTILATISTFITIVFAYRSLQ